MTRGYFWDNPVFILKIVLFFSISIKYRVSVLMFTNVLCKHHTPLFTIHQAYQFDNRFSKRFFLFFIFKKSIIYVCKVCTSQSYHFFCSQIQLISKYFMWKEDILWYFTENIWSPNMHGKIWWPIGDTYEYILNYDACCWYIFFEFVNLFLLLFCVFTPEIIFCIIVEELL